jgi:hypothetical protein
MSARLAGAAMLMALVAASGGCTKHQTEMIVVVTTEGVRIPDDVRKLHLTVADRFMQTDDTVYEQDVELCTAQLTTGCFNLPVTATLFPGKTRGSDSVRVQVDAIGANGPVIANAALFTFAEHESLRLDFVLYANCLGNVECAKRDQACGPTDQCISLQSTMGPGIDDFGGPPSTGDMAEPQQPPDMTREDLSGVDLYTPPPDLTTIVDLSGCGGVTCGPGQTCIAGVCTSCGMALNDPCCFGPAAPPPYPNAGGTGSSGTCSQPNLVCNGSTCVNCGAPGELCCASSNCFIGFCATTGVCQAFDMSMVPPPMDFGVPHID